MTLECPLTTPLDFVLRAERFYAALMQHAVVRAAEEPGLGGSLLYAGELNAAGRALTVAGNAAGAATLAATADLAAQKQAVREGAVDFLVTSLDEALRILKNEIRKRENVAVCVGTAPATIEQEMQERGVQPDLLARGAWPNAGGLAVHRIEEAAMGDGRVLLAWQVSAAPALWMPRLDDLARRCLGTGDQTAMRWLRLAPRYCGRAAMSLRALRCSSQVVQEFAAYVAEAIKSGEIGVPVEITTDAG